MLRLKDLIFKDFSNCKTIPRMQKISFFKEKTLSVKKDILLSFFWLYVFSYVNFFNHYDDKLILLYVSMFWGRLKPAGAVLTKSCSMESLCWSSPKTGSFYILYFFNGLDKLSTLSLIFLFSSFSILFPILWKQSDVFYVEANEDGPFYFCWERPVIIN